MSGRFLPTNIIEPQLLKSVIFYQFLTAINFHFVSICIFVAILFVVTSNIFYIVHFNDMFTEKCAYNL